MGIYVFDGAFLARILHVDAAHPESGHDFGADILPRLIEGGCAYSYAFRGAGGSAQAYWRDVGTLDAYWRAHMELLGPTPLLTLDDPSWPIGRAAAAPQIVLPANDHGRRRHDRELDRIRAAAASADRVVRSRLCPTMSTSDAARESPRPSCSPAP